MKQGEVIPSRGKQSLILAVGVWARREKADGPITIRLAAPGHFITTVTNEPGSKRYHPKVFSHLKKLLKQHGRWSFKD